ncbi:progestin and adipoQ receptor family member 3a isoform X1 [Electrophorus electricus]|uniref:progestin and adipoQ receptor family member 3a isoform X1 n=1 Tax=Electrophorus electricus TaxID=8005 RepID=UPI000F09BC83|nr:progestin and adipoQ receptor family member 3a isoform X1 [Electrophorus electricus]
MPSTKALKNAQYIELGGYQYWPVLVPRGIRLYTYEQVPGFLRENPYITDGYRAYLTSRLCIKSLFILSNETVNIWSHLLGFLLFFLLGLYDMIAVLPVIGATREDYVIYSIGLFCYQVCMLCSVGYHLFCCHRSEKTSRRWMALDYAGISIGTLGCYVPGIFYAFYCNNYWRQVYLVMVLAMTLGLFFAQIHPHYLTKQWQKLRSVIFCSVAAYGLVPTLHWIWLSGGFGSAVVQVTAEHQSPRTSEMVNYHTGGLCSQSAGDVFVCCSCLCLLSLQSSRTLLPRSAELCGLQPPGVAHPGGADVLLVAPVSPVHHQLPPHKPLPRLPSACLGLHQYDQRIGTCENHVMTVSP